MDSGFNQVSLPYFENENIFSHRILNNLLGHHRMISLRLTRHFLSYRVQQRQGKKSRKKKVEQKTREEKEHRW